MLETKTVAYGHVLKVCEDIVAVGPIIPLDSRQVPSSRVVVCTRTNYMLVNRAPLMLFWYDSPTRYRTSLWQYQQHLTLVSLHGDNASIVKFSYLS